MARFVVDPVGVDALTEPAWDELYRLEQEFTDATREQFERGVRSYSVMVRVREGRGGPLVGMGCMHWFAYELGGRQCLYQTTGVARFRPHVRGQSIVQRYGFRQFVRRKLRHPLTPMYLFYDTFSFRSFVMLARNFSTYWPHPDRPTPPEVADFFARYGAEHYAEHWDAAAGVCKGSYGQRLRAGVATVDAAALADPIVAFFVEKNPGHAQGDRLPVLVPLTARNWFDVLRRIAMRRRRQRE